MRERVRARACVGRWWADWSERARVVVVGSACAGASVWQGEVCVGWVGGWGACCTLPACPLGTAHLRQRLATLLLLTLQLAHAVQAVLALDHARCVAHLRVRGRWGGCGGWC
jgi:hypothetical protein